MKAILALAAFCLLSQAHGHVAGQVDMVDGKATKQCQDCVNFFTDLKQMVSSQNTTVQIEQLLKQMVCSQLGTLESMCNDLVDMYVPQLLQQLASMEDPQQICGVIGFCTEDMKNFIMRKVQMPKGEECDLCKDVVNELQTLVRDPSTQNFIKNYIDNNVCPLFGTLQQQCKQEVETYAALVFQVLVNELDPDVVCDTLGMCTQTKKVHMSRIGLASAPTKVKVISPEKVKVMQPKVKDNECVLCEFVMKEIDQMLENNATVVEIKDALDKVCSLLPTTIRDECTQFVNTYAQTIITLLIDEVTPDQVCQALGLCQQIKATPECVLCEFVMTKLDDLIASNKSRAAVEAALENVCNLMPDTISQECQTFVEEYGPAVIQMIVEDLNPKDVCKTVRLCTSTRHVVTVKKPVVKAVGASLECTICEFVMQEIDTLIGDNRTEQAVESALDKVCSRLPSTINATCKDFVNTYGPAIFELLVQELAPEAVCTTLGLCQSKLPKQVKQVKRVKGEECDLCVQVVTYAQSLLKENATAQEIIAVLDKVCNFLPGNISDQCTEFVQDYAVVVLNLIASDLDPRQICEEIKLCNASRKAWELKNNRLYFKPTNLVGTKECTYGPAYWCATVENAKKCNAEEHCQKHVWNKKGQ